MRTKLLLLLITILVATFISVPGCGGSSEDPPIVVVFTDPDLDQAVRDAIGQPTGHIQAASLLGLLTLDASGLTIADLEGIQYCLDLETLSLQNNNLTNASHLNRLSALVNLTTLRLDMNGISTLGWITTLTNLTTLNLRANNLVDITDLAGLTLLVTLRLADNQIVNMDALELLVDLETLLIDHNLITDVTVFINNTGIDTATDTINIEDNPLSCQAFADIAGEPRLAALAYTDPGRTFTDPLLEAEIGAVLGHPSPFPQSELCGITIFAPVGAGIADLTGLEFCTELVNLDLTANVFTDITPITGLANLETLAMAGVGLTSIAGIQLLRDTITDLNLNGNDLTDLTPLAGFTHCTTLGLADNLNLVDIGQIADFESLVNLNLTNDALVVDPAPLCNCFANGGLQAGSTVILTGTPLSAMIGVDACLIQLAADGVTLTP